MMEKLRIRSMDYAVYGVPPNAVRRQRASPMAARTGHYRMERVEVGLLPWAAWWVSGGVAICGPPLAEEAYGPRHLPYIVIPANAGGALQQRKWSSSALRFVVLQKSSLPSLPTSSSRRTPEAPYNSEAGHPAPCASLYCGSRPFRPFLHRHPGERRDPAPCASVVPQKLDSWRRASYLYASATWPLTQRAPHSPAGKRVTFSLLAHACA